MTKLPGSEPWFVYILRCADGSFYTGVTTDIDRRRRQHNAGTAARYTRSRRPIRVVYRETAASHSAALRREAAIKSLTRPQKIRLIRTKKQDAAR